MSNLVLQARRSSQPTVSTARLAPTFLLMLRSRLDDLYSAAFGLTNCPGVTMPISAQDEAMKQNGGVALKVMVSDNDSSSAESSSTEGEKAVTSKISGADDESPTTRMGDQDPFAFDKRAGLSPLTQRQSDTGEHTVAPILQRLHSDKEKTSDSPRAAAHKSNLGNRAITSFRDEDLLEDLKTNIKPYQNRLLLLLHAASCKGDNHSCRIPHECAAFKQV